MDVYNFGQEDYLYRIQVYKKTLEESERFKIVESIKYHTRPQQVLKLRKYNTRANIIVINEDTINAALKYPNSVMLNMANAFIPGGGVCTGCPAQEEDIFRRTNYNKTLEYTREFYPIINNQAIYSPDVTVFKGTEKDKYPYQSPRKISIIASASIDCRSEKFDPVLQEEKIDMIFNIASFHGHNTLILSAFGCGAFRCDPGEVSKIFKKVIQKYGHQFENIVFAILHNNTNYQIFKQVLES
jgi:uncharacterized protein (TIGR02452 family)